VGNNAVTCRQQVWTPCGTLPLLNIHTKQRQEHAAGAAAHMSTQPGPQNTN
jgi:hypothetical protein